MIFPGSKLGKFCLGSKDSVEIIKPFLTPFCLVILKKRTAFIRMDYVRPILFQRKLCVDVQFGPFGTIIWSQIWTKAINTDHELGTKGLREPLFSRIKVSKLLKVMFKNKDIFEIFWERPNYTYYDLWLMHESNICDMHINESVQFHVQFCTGKSSNCSTDLIYARKIHKSVKLISVWYNGNVWKNPGISGALYALQIQY